MILLNKDRTQDIFMISELVNFDIRSDMFNKATRFVNYEIVEGDVVEFGVYTGRSLALLSHYHNKFRADKVHGNLTPERKIIGIDSFQGLAANEHVRWPEGSFSVNHSWHPILAEGARVEPEHISAMFKYYSLEKPVIIEGYFSDVGDDFNAICSKVSIIHIDCDLYEATRDALNLVRGKIQDGTIIMFDDWFNFKASSNKGEQKAFYEFLKENPFITAVPYQKYGTFCNSFVLKV
jgi:O-methyltransferase